MKIYTRKELDALLKAGCSEHHSSSAAPLDEIFLHPRCHPKDGTWASYSGGVVRVACKTCEKEIMNIAVSGDDCPRSVVVDKLLEIGKLQDGSAPFIASDLVSQEMLYDIQAKLVELLISLDPGKTEKTFPYLFRQPEK